MGVKKHPDAAGFQVDGFTAVPGKGYVDEALDHRLPYSLVCVWNPVTLEPELMQQPGPGFTETYWLDERYEYSGGNLIYLGKNTTHKEAEAATTWMIWKFTWDATPNCTRIEGPLSGSWTGRAALAWA